MYILDRTGANYVDGMDCLLAGWLVVGEGQSKSHTPKRWEGFGGLMRDLWIDKWDGNWKRGDEARRGNRLKEGEYEGICFFSDGGDKPEIWRPD
jgi:hypothetical protein